MKEKSDFVMAAAAAHTFFKSYASLSEKAFFQPIPAISEVTYKNVP